MHKLVIKGLACLFDRRQAEPPVVFPRTVVTKPSAGCGLWRRGEWHQRGGTVVDTVLVAHQPTGAVPDFWSGSSNRERSPPEQVTDTSI